MKNLAVDENVYILPFKKIIKRYWALDAKYPFKSKLYSTRPGFTIYGIIGRNLEETLNIYKYAVICTEVERGLSYYLRFMDKNEYNIGGYYIPEELIICSKFNIKIDDQLFEF